MAESIMNNSRTSEVIRLAIFTTLLTFMPSPASGQALKVKLTQHVDAAFS
jgi:hypothetical protein